MSEYTIFTPICRKLTPTYANLCQVGLRMHSSFTHPIKPQTVENTRLFADIHGELIIADSPTGYIRTQLSKSLIILDFSRVVIRIYTTCTPILRSVVQNSPNLFYYSHLIFDPVGGRARPSAGSFFYVYPSSHKRLEWHTETPVRCWRKKKSHPKVAQ